LGGIDAVARRCVRRDRTRYHVEGTPTGQPDGFRQGLSGNPARMSVMELVSAPFRWGSALRGRRIFHPDGVVAEGVIDRLAPVDAGLPLPSAKIVARVSKALGTPNGLPDIIGLAFRILSHGDSSAECDWDVLLASALPVPIIRSIGLRPVTSWTGSSMTSLAPLRYHDANWWLRARITTQIDGSGLSLDGIRNALQQGEIAIDVDQGRATSAFHPLARVTLTNPTPGRDVSFDPVLHTAPDVEMYPHWLADLRAYAYAQSREGRAKDHASTDRN
jgi:hypothetical protein